MKPFLKLGILELGMKKITPQAIYEENGTWHLFYEGRDHQNFMQGGVAIADHPMDHTRSIAPIL